jgi:RNA recognition motif-containing protein
LEDTWNIPGPSHACKQPLYMKLIVKNLPLDVNSDRLKQLFDPFGEVVSAEVVYDRFNGYSRGYGFVKMKQFSSGFQAITSLNGTILKDLPLIVQEKA